MNLLSSLLYELRPLSYALFSGFSISHSGGSNVIIFASVMLAACSFIVFKWRIQYRYRKRRAALESALPLQKSYARPSAPALKNQP
jgi:hypothetical protein